VLLHHVSDTGAAERASDLPGGRRFATQPPLPLNRERRRRAGARCADVESVRIHSALSVFPVKPAGRAGQEFAARNRNGGRASVAAGADGLVELAR